MTDPVSGPPVIAPGSRYVAEVAIAFTGDDGRAVRIDRAHPLPIEQRALAAGSIPLAGSVAASAVVGPFTPELGRAIELRLWGTWAGSVTVRDSIDGGATKLPLTAGGQPWAIFTTGVNEEEVKTPHVAGQTFWIDATISSGTLYYWMGQ